MRNRQKLKALLMLCKKILAIHICHMHKYPLEFSVRSKLLTDLVSVSPVCLLISFANKNSVLCLGCGMFNESIFLQDRLRIQMIFWNVIEWRPFLKVKIKHKIKIFILLDSVLILGLFCKNLKGI